MAAYGKAQHGKTEIAQGAGVDRAWPTAASSCIQSSQASASHLMAGVLRGLQTRRPAVFNIYTPCPVEHGLADDWATSTRPGWRWRAGRSPSSPTIPTRATSWADCLSLDGNPSPEDAWPTYTTGVPG